MAKEQHQGPESSPIQKERLMSVPTITVRLLRLKRRIIAVDGIFIQVFADSKASGPQGRKVRR